MLFEHCPRMWYFEKILKIPIEQDTKYMDAGTCLHDTMEKHYNKEFKDITETKEYFNKRWKELKLDETDLQKDEYWLMVLRGIEVDRKFTSMELKIYYPEVVAYLDGVNTETHEIVDWKTSKREKWNGIVENEAEYERQVKLYAWLYKRKFGVIPKKLTVYYLRYTGEKGEMNFFPTEEDVQEAEKWYKEINKKQEYYADKKICPGKCDECYKWCRYKDHCEKYDVKRLDYKIHTLNNYMKVEGPIPEILDKQLTKKFSYELKGAYFIKKNNPYANTTVKFWLSDCRMMPIGFLKGLKKTLKDYAQFKKMPGSIKQIEHRKFDDLKVEMPDELQDGKELREYQFEAVEAFLKDKIAMIQIATGGGKSLVLIEILRRLACSSIIIVHRIELLRQLKADIERSLGIEVGVIAEGEMDYKPITVATIQTIMSKFEEVKPFLNEVRFAAIDEAHMINHKSYWAVANQLKNTEYRLAMSGTLTRTDGNEMYLNAVAGYKCYELNAHKLIQDEWIMRPEIKFMKNFMDEKNIKLTEITSTGDEINATEKYEDKYKAFIVFNEERNQVIQDIVDKHKDDKILILTNRIDHGVLLAERLGAPFLQGETPKKERLQLMEDFKSEKLNILIATISIMAEGLNIHLLQVLINASGLCSEIKNVQSLGRLLRKHPDKKGCIYYDFLDENRFMRKASWNRIRAFKSQGHNVEIIDWAKK